MLGLMTSCLHNGTRRSSSGSKEEVGVSIQLARPDTNVIGIVDVHLDIMFDLLFPLLSQMEAFNVLQ